MTPEASQADANQRGREGLVWYDKKNSMWFEFDVNLKLESIQKLCETIASIIS